MFVYSKISANNPSKLVNAWRERLATGNYFITPVNVVLHVQHDKFQKSKFLEKLGSLQWQVPRLYDGDFENDCAWARVSEG